MSSSFLEELSRGHIQLHSAYSCKCQCHSFKIGFVFPRSSLGLHADGIAILRKTSLGGFLSIVFRLGVLLIVSYLTLNYFSLRFSRKLNLDYSLHPDQIPVINFIPSGASGENPKFIQQSNYQHTSISTYESRQASVGYAAFSASQELTNQVDATNFYLQNMSSPLFSPSPPRDIVSGVRVEFRIERSDQMNKIVVEASSPFTTINSMISFQDRKSVV